MTRILLIEDDTSFATLLQNFLNRKGYETTVAYTFAEGLNKISKENYQLIMCDLRLPDGDGISLTQKVKLQFPDLPVILMTGYADVNTAISAMKNGASDYISKPFNPDEVLIIVKNALEITVKTSITKEQKSPEREVKTSYVTGIGAVSKKLSEYIKLVAPTDMSVMIIGESGTGKEVIAQHIHEASSRKGKPFIAVDCGAIPKELAASEFFGHLKGSFTGAISDKIGYFQAANGGTIFLDEIGNLSYENQIQLLRALQERKIKPVGSNKEIPVNIRIITATNENLREAVKEGTFREDLFHRINEFSIDSPALRERTEDIMIFADHFLDQSNEELNKSIEGFSPNVVDIFMKYSWPGNVREMKNVVKRSTLLSQGNTIETNALPSELFETNQERYGDMSIETNEKQLIINALEKTNQNKTEAAKILNITRKTLYNKLKLYQLD